MYTDEHVQACKIDYKLSNICIQSDSKSNIYFHSMNHPNERNRIADSSPRHRKNNSRYSHNRPKLIIAHGWSLRKTRKSLAIHGQRSFGRHSASHWSSLLLLLFHPPSASRSSTSPSASCASPAIRRFPPNEISSGVLFFFDSLSITYYYYLRHCSFWFRPLDVSPSRSRSFFWLDGAFLRLVSAEDSFRRSHECAQNALLHLRRVRISSAYVEFRKCNRGRTGGKWIYRTDEDTKFYANFRSGYRTIYISKIYLVLKLTILLILNVNIWFKKHCM